MKMHLFNLYKYMIFHKKRTSQKKFGSLFKNPTSQLKETESQLKRSDHSFLKTGSEFKKTGQKLKKTGDSDVILRKSDGLTFFSKNS